MKDKILLIDDVSSIRKSHSNAILDSIKKQGLTNVEVVSVTKEKLNEISPEKSGNEITDSVEDDFANYLINNRDIKLVVADRDLHKYNGNIRSESTITEGASMAAIPVCGYSRRARKNHPGIKISQFADGVTTPMIDVEKDSANLANQVVEIFLGMRRIQEKIDGMSIDCGLSEIASKLLGEPGQEVYFKNYPLTLPARTDLLNLDDLDNQKLFVSFRLALWLYKYILPFPGITLNKKSAAAYLNLKECDFIDNLSVFESCKYNGPFSEFSDYWWRYKLDDYLIENELIDGVEWIKANTDVDVEGISLNEETQFLCVITEEIVSYNNSIRFEIAPHGADLARITRRVAEKWQMYLP